MLERMTKLETRVKELNDSFNNLLPEMKRCVKNAPTEKQSSLWAKLSLLAFSPTPLTEIPDFLKPYASKN